MITLLVPIHEYKEEYKEYIDKCHQSYKINNPTSTQKLKFVCDEKVKAKIQEQLNNTDEEFIINNTGKTSIFHQINHAVDFVDTDYFGIYEFDDMISDRYFSVAERYINENKDVALFLPLIGEVIRQQKEDGSFTESFVRYANEFPWFKGMIEYPDLPESYKKLGVITTKMAEGYEGIQLSGAIIKKEDFLETKKLKTNLGIATMYEYMLRLTFLDKKVISIPKFMYIHRIARENSYFENIKNTLTPEAIMKFFDLARKEYVFEDEREIENNLIP